MTVSQECLETQPMESNMCVQVSLTRKLGYVHDRQPTMILQVSFRIRTEKKKEKIEKEKKRKMQICNCRIFFANLICLN